MPSPPNTPSPRRPRVAIATLYDEAFAPIGWMCRNALARYGKRHGHDVVVARSFESDRPAPWAKVPFVRALFDSGYDHVFWVDADALIADPSHDVAELIDDSKDMQLVRHRLSGFPSRVPNTGVFLMRNCDWSKRLLDKMWSLDQYAHGTWWENAAFIHLLGSQDYQEQGVVNPDGCLIDATRLGWLPERWNRVRRHGEGGSTIIRHFAGKSRNNRLRNMPLWLNWPSALHHEWNRQPTPLDLPERGVIGASLEYAAPRGAIQSHNHQKAA